MTDARDKVAVVACGGYGEEEVTAAVERALALAGMGSTGPGTAFVKPNIVRDAAPGLAVTTHPLVVGTLVRHLVQHGCTVSVGDCPGMHIDAPGLKRMYHACGITEAVEAAGGQICVHVPEVKVPLPEGKLLQQIPVAQPIAGADLVVSASKLKTHSLCTMTGAVKNLFGIIPGLQKAELHARFPMPDDFADALIDICLASRASIHVMDAVVGMEGPGPTAGTPRLLGVILAGANPFALDVVAARLMGLDPMKVATIRKSVARGLLKADFSDVVTVGDDWQALAARPPFKSARKREYIVHGILRRILPRPVLRQLRLRPMVLPQLCVGCRECSKACPPHAITMKDNRPSIDLSVCIRCYCCQELCPRHAFVIRRGWQATLFPGK